MAEVKIQELSTQVTTNAITIINLQKQVAAVPAFAGPVKVDSPWGNNPLCPNSVAALTNHSTISGLFDQQAHSQFTYEDNSCL